MKIIYKLVSIILFLFFSTYSYGQHNDTVLMNSRIIKSFEIHNYLDNIGFTKKMIYSYDFFGYYNVSYLLFDERVYNVLDTVIAYIKYNDDYKVIVNISYHTKANYPYCIIEQHIRGALFRYFNFYLPYADVIDRILFNDLDNEFFLHKEGSNEMRENNASITILIYK